MKIPLQLLIIAVNLALCSILAVRGIYRSYPCFCRYAFFQCFASISSLIVYTCGR